MVDLIDKLPDAALEFDTTGTVLRANDRATNLFGLSGSKSLVGLRAWDLPGSPLDESAWRTIATGTSSCRIWREHRSGPGSHGGTGRLAVSATRRSLDRSSPVIIVRFSPLERWNAGLASLLAQVQALLGIPTTGLSLSTATDIFSIGLAHGLGLPLVCFMRHHVETSETEMLGSCQGEVASHALKFKENPFFRQTVAEVVATSRPVWFDYGADPQIREVVPLSHCVHWPLFRHDGWMNAIALMIPASVSPEAGRTDLLEMVAGIAAMRLQAVASAAPTVPADDRGDAVFGFDREGRIRYWNERCSEVFRLDGDAPIGRPFWDLKAGIGSCPGDPATVRQLFEGESVAPAEWRRSGSNGGHGKTILHLVGLTGPDGRVDVGIGRIAGGRQRTKGDALSYSTAASAVPDPRWIEARRLESIGGLAISVVRELNGALARILGNASVLRRRLETDPHNLEKARAICSAAEGAAKTADRLLGMAERNGHTWSRVQINELVTDVMGLVQSSFEGRAFRVLLDPRMPAIHMMQPGISQMLLALVNNAVEASDPGRPVVVESVRVAEDAVPAECGDSGRRWIALRVTDRGPGVAAAWRERIFEPHFSTKPDGRGLGLAVARGVAQLHGGTLVYEEGPQGGSRFVAYLPVGDEAVDQVPSPSLPRTVFIATGDAAVGAVVGSMAVALGQCVLQANGDSDVASFLRTKACVIDVVVLDADLAPNDRAAVDRALDLLPADVPVVLLASACPVPTHETADRRYVALPKPFGFKEFESAMRRTFRVPYRTVA